MPNPLDKYFSQTDFSYFWNRIKIIFAKQTDLDTLDAKVDEIISEGGEPNVIETVKVNGTALTPDAQKAVDVTVPTKTSDLINDGSDSSASPADPFATESYVDQYGGKIDVIKVNGVAQTITNKEVDLDVPTKVSDITNDSGFQTASDVSGSIATALANGNDPYATTSDVDTAISSAVASAYKYKGSVATYADLPVSGLTAGDVYDVQADGMNYAWNGTSWDALGQYVDTSLYWAKAELVAMTTAEIDAIIDAV